MSAITVIPVSIWHRAKRSSSVSSGGTFKYNTLFVTLQLVEMLCEAETRTATYFQTKRALGLLRWPTNGVLYNGRNLRYRNNFPEIELKPTIMLQSSSLRYKKNCLSAVSMPWQNYVLRLRFLITTYIRRAFPRIVKKPSRVRVHPLPFFYCRIRIKSANYWR